MDDIVTVAAVQMHSAFGCVAANRAKIGHLAREAARGGARLIVTPETSICGYATDDLATIWQVPGRPIYRLFRGADPRPLAETVPGPSTDELGRLTRELRTYLCVGLIERVGEALYNTAVLLGPDGQIAGHYRKLKPWPIVERSWATPGDLGAPVVPTQFGTVGFAVCYDINWVELRYAGTPLQTPLWTLLFPSAWVDIEPVEYFTEGRLPAVARRLRVNIVQANRCVPARQWWIGSGGSSVVSSVGTVVGDRAGEFEEATVLAPLPARPGAVQSAGDTARPRR